MTIWRTHRIGALVMYPKAVTGVAIECLAALRGLCPRLASVVLPVLAAVFATAAWSGPTVGQSLVPEASTEQGYTCPMHPSYVSDQAGSCPICGMDLVPIRSAGTGGAPRSADDTGGVTVSPAIIQSIGVRTQRVREADFGRRVRAFGAVEASARLQRVVASRVAGWIESLAADAQGDRVRAGDLLYRVFSPDLLAAQQDHLSALATGNATRIDSTRRRLRSLGMQAEVVARLARDRQPIEEVPVYAEADGVVAALAVRDGDYVAPGHMLMRLQAYDEVWVVAAVAEQDLAGIRAGMPVRLDFPTLAAAGRTGTVDYVYPEIDARTRTGRVRIVIDNAEENLKPGAFTDVRFEVDARPRLAVPSQAVLRDSSGSHVIVALGDGRFAGRDIVTGVTADGLTEVRAGLQPGEDVVVSGQFLLDSEASLRESFTRFGGGASGRHGGHAGNAHGAPTPQQGDHDHDDAGDMGDRGAAGGTNGANGTHDAHMHMPTTTDPPQPAGPPSREGGA